MFPFPAEPTTPCWVNCWSETVCPATTSTEYDFGNGTSAFSPAVLSQRGGRVLPGAEQLLSRLADEPHVRSHVMTGNLAETATKKLEYFDLLRHVESVFGGDFDSHRNDLARRTADLIRARDGDAATCDMIVIGDTPADILCGHAIGAEVVAVCTGWHSREELAAEDPMVIVDDFSDVSSVFAMLVDDDPAHRHGRVLRGD